MMSSPSKRSVGKSNRSELGSTGDTPAKAQQPRTDTAAADNASPADAGASPAAMSVGADDQSVLASGGAARPTLAANMDCEADALPTGGSAGQNLAYSYHYPQTF